MGIGNNPTAGQAPDYTSTGNAASFTTRNLYVLVRPGGNAPVLLSQPRSKIVADGGNSTFAVTATGPGTLTYQWRFNGAPISGATSPWLDLTAITAGQAGAYDVIVSAPGGVSTTSLAATLTVANQNPTFGGFAFSTSKNTAVAIARASFVAKAFDPDGQPLAVTAAGPASGQGGSASLGASAVTYTPPGNFVGADTFTVTIGDGEGGSVGGTVNVTVTSATVPADGQAAIGRRIDGKVDTLFAGIPGESYDVQRNPNLGNPLGWQTIGTVLVGDDGLLPFTDPNPPAEKAFYRLVPLAP